MISKTQKFVNYVRDEIEKDGGKLRLSDSKYVIADGNRVNGYFDVDDPKCAVIAVATDYHYKKWLATLSHEFAHFQQFKKNCAPWRNVYLKNGEDSGNLIDEWLKGDDIPLKAVKDALTRYRNMELDCERRSAENIVKFDLPLNVDRYCQRASAYVYFYNYMLESRKWYSVGNEPYRVKAITDVMPKTLKGRYDRMPKWMIELYKEYL